MKKLKLLSILLIAFLFSLAFTYSSSKKVMATDETNTEHKHCICGVSVSVGDHNNHIDVVYSPWNGGNFNYDGDDTNTGAAYLYLTEDVVLSSNSCNRNGEDGILTIKKEQTLYLCLNGHSLKNGEYDNNTIDVYGSLILCDCTGDGTIGGRKEGANSGAIWLSDASFTMYGGNITGSTGVKNGGGVYAKGTSVMTMYGGSVKDNVSTRQGGGIYLTEKSSLIMYGGVIENNSAPQYGGGVIVDNGTTFTMYGGSITNNFSGGDGGGVFVSGGTFTMNGGTISNNVASNGGGVSVTYDYVRGTFALNNGTIEGNTAYSNGGGIYIWDRGTFEMYDGLISNNKATYGGGVCLYSQNKDSKNINNVLELYSGVIKNNTASKFGGGVCCFQYSVLNFHGTNKIIIDENKDTNLQFLDKCSLTIDNLTSDSKIGVSWYMTPLHGEDVTICALPGTDLGKYFYSDSDEYIIKSTTSEILLTSDFYTSKIKYVTGCEDVIVDELKRGLTEELELVITMTKPTMKCREFLGWTDDETENVVKFNSGDKINVKGEITLYAVYSNEEHTLIHNPGVEATCTSDGFKPHFMCKTCLKLFLDENATQEVTLDDLEVNAIGHNLVKVDMKEATCTAEGVEEHYKCNECNKLFRNQLATEEVTLDDLKISLTKHDLVKTDMKEATCTDEGIKEHCKCKNCEKLFVYVYGVQVEVVDKDEFVISKRHKFGEWIDKIEATKDKEGVLGHKDCEFCHKHFNEHDEEIIDLTISKIVPTKQTSKGKVIGITVLTSVLTVGVLEALAYIIVKQIKKKH